MLSVFLGSNDQAREGYFVFCPQRHTRYRNYLEPVTGSRAGVIGITEKGEFVSVANFQADTKWPEYEEFCGRLYFVALPEFTKKIFPDYTGVISDRFQGAEESSHATDT